MFRKDREYMRGYRGNRRGYGGRRRRSFFWRWVGETILITAAARLIRRMMRRY